MVAVRSGNQRGERAAARGPNRAPGLVGAGLLTMAAVASIAPAPEVRGALRDLLSASAGYNSLPRDSRRDIAHSLVRIAHVAHVLAKEAEEPQPVPAARQMSAPLAVAQSAGSEFSGTAVDRMAGTTQAMLGAISFPRFVNELITGVFKALVDSNQQQLQSYIELIRSVAASTGDFADANVGIAGARSWLAERFPGNFEVQGSDDEASPDELREMEPDERQEYEAERARSTRLVLRPGAEMPAEGALKAALGLRPEESLPGGGPENLVGFARQALARNRQQMLSTMVMMGLQRIVVESGRLHASMRFHIDARSAAAEDRGSSFDFRNETAATGRVGFGPWGVSATVKNTIGYVSTQNVSTTEELNASATVNSSVELLFRSDYVPLTRLAGVQDLERIRLNTINPEAETQADETADRERLAAQRTAEESRRSEVRTRLAERPSLPDAPELPAPQPQTPGSGADSPHQTGTEIPASATDGNGGRGRGGTSDANQGAQPSGNGGLGSLIRSAAGSIGDAAAGAIDRGLA